MAGAALCFLFSGYADRLSRMGGAGGNLQEVLEAC